MSVAIEETGDEFLAVAYQAMAGPDGAAALDSLGWWDLLPHLDDPEARAAVFGVFRAQGRALASSPALAGILTQPYLAAAGLEAGTVVAPMRRTATGGTQVWTLVGDPAGRSLLLADPSEGIVVVDPDDVELTPIEVPGRLAAFELTGGAATAGDVVARPTEHQLRLSMLLGRLAAATEMLGAAEGAVQLARDHGCDREQFGRPIAAFQAVRHLLAWATTDCVAVESVLGEAIRMLRHPSPHFDEVVKALAGRNARRACERSLQVLGGIGFTAEHVHHHHHSRVLFLDAVLGTSAELTRGLGEWLRTDSDDPLFARGALLAPAALP